MGACYFLGCSPAKSRTLYSSDLPGDGLASVFATGFALSRSNPYTRISNAELPFLTTRPNPARVVRWSTRSTRRRRRR